MKSLLFFTFFFLTSCASYIQEVHNQIDLEERQMRGISENQQPRNNNQKGAWGNNSLDYTNKYQPPVNRTYTGNGSNRASAQDLMDNDNSGSLWSGKKGDSFLFVNRNIKSEGDIVVIEVRKNLKENISKELERSFPPPKVSAQKGKKPEEEKKEDAPASTNSTGKENKDEVYDKISARVVEKLSKDYLLIRGQKEILHQNVKRYMQYQAVVQSKYVTANDTVSSDDLIEDNIIFIRN
jgi:flagellar basal body L-ring protein FlgH